MVDDGILKFPSVLERSPLSLGWPLTVAHGSAPSLHKHGSSMASNDGGSSDRQRVAQQRLRIITGHLQRSEDGDQTIVAAECKAQQSKSDVSGEGKTVPRRRYWAGMERRRIRGLQPLVSLSSLLIDTVANWYMWKDLPATSTDVLVSTFFYWWRNGTRLKTGLVSLLANVSELTLRVTCTFISNRKGAASCLRMVRVTVVKLANCGWEAVSLFHSLSSFMIWTGLTFPIGLNSCLGRAWFWNLIRDFTFSFKESLAACTVAPNIYPQQFWFSISTPFGDRQFLF